MKIQVFSDIHLEFYKSFSHISIEPLCDILILAGDIGFINDKNYQDFIEYISTKWKYIFIVLGNHEFYSKKHRYERLLNKYKIFFEKYSNIYLLDKDVFEWEYNGEKWCIIGCTLWCFISDISYDKLNCSKYIKVYNDIKERLDPISLDGFNEMHKKDRKWLVETFNCYKEKHMNMIILTHYPIKNNYLINNNKYMDNSNENGFYNNIGIEKTSRENKIVCISGHTHYSFDKEIDNIRYISNQQGYRDETKTKFNIDGIFDV